MNETALIRIAQFPVIEERLRALKDEWEQKATDAKSLVCTEDTIQGVKKARAEMRKEFEEADRQRKAAKISYMAPWVRIEEVYQECVENAYRRADETYKGKISEIENAQKAECEKKCREYFAELVQVHGLPWLKYDQAGLKISLTEAKKKNPSGHYDKLSEFVARVACDMDAIQGDAEAAAEYKANGLNLARAQKTIRERREAAEQERKSTEERAERQRLEAEAIAKVEAAAATSAPPVEVKAEPLLTVSFKATATREKLIALRDYMKAEGIKYE